MSVSVGHVDVLIIGAGLSGLTAANEIRKKASSLTYKVPLNCVRVSVYSTVLFVSQNTLTVWTEFRLHAQVLEAKNRVGGRLESKNGRL